MTKIIDPPGKTAHSFIDPFTPETWDNAHREYFERINYLINADSASPSRLIGNSSGIHAAYIIAHFIGNSHDKVRVLTRCLSRESKKSPGVKLWANTNIINKVKDFLKRDGASFEILVGEDIEDIESHQLLNDLREFRNSREYRGSFSIRKPSENDCWSAKQVNYLIRDYNSIRVEFDPSPKNISARVGFGRSALINKAVAFHDGLWSNASVIDY